MPGPVALTGATGFIGSHILSACLASGRQVFALTRSPRPAMPGVNWIIGDLFDMPALGRLLADAEAVIHCAGVVRGASAREFQLTNVVGTENVIRMANRAASPPRFLLISSLAARMPGLSWYAASKRIAENRLSALAGTMPWTILRPTAVYGPGDREMRPLFDALRRGWFLMPGGGEKKLSLLHVSDLARLATLWLDSPEIPRGTYEVDDAMPGGYDPKSLIRLAEKVWHRKIRAVAVPLFVLRTLAHGNLFLHRLVGGQPMLTPGKVRELAHPDWSVNAEPLMAALPWRPEITLQTALGDDKLVFT